MAAASSVKPGLAEFDVVPSCCTVEETTLLAAGAGADATGAETDELAATDEGGREKVSIGALGALRASRGGIGWAGAPVPA